MGSQTRRPRFWSPLLEVKCGCLKSTLTNGLLRFQGATVPVYSLVVSEITELLDDDAAGDRQAAAELLPLVYDELRKLAAVRMAAETPGHTLDATALVHEAFFRLISDQHFEGRGHFFTARPRRCCACWSTTRGTATGSSVGGGRKRVDLDPLTGPAAAADGDRLELDDARERLAIEFPVAAELVKLRFFAGMTLGDGADALDIHRWTAQREAFSPGLDSPFVSSPHLRAPSVYGNRRQFKRRMKH